MTGWQQVRVRATRRARRAARALPRRARRTARRLITGAETALAVRRDGRMRHEDALRLLNDAARRNPADVRVARLRAQVLARTGRLTAALAEATRLVVRQGADGAGAAGASNRRLQRTLQGRVAETDAGWAPRVPGGPPTHQPAPGRVLYLAKESFPHLNNGYCTRTHETLLAVNASGRDARAVTLPGFPAAEATGGARPARTSVVDAVEYRHVLPGAAGTLAELPWEEYLQLTTTSFAREVARVRPEVLHTGSGRRGYDLALVGRALAEWAGLPWIYEVRSFFETTWTPDERYAEQAEYYRRRFAAETRAMTAADAVVTLSGPMREEIVTGHGIDPGKVFVIPNAVDLERFRPAGRDEVHRARLGLAGLFVLGYVSNLDHHREGQEVLLEAAAMLRRQGHQVGVLLVGDGRRRPELERRARELGLGSAAVFAGAVPFADVPRWYELIDLFVVPRVPERAARLVSPMKPFEAMALGVPVMVSDLPALTEISGPAQERALVFTAGDARSLADRAGRVIGRPEELSGRAEAAGAWVRAERTWAGNGRAFDEVYRFAAERHAERSAGPSIDVRSAPAPAPAPAQTRAQAC